jgi:hypothetical protein
MMYYILGIILWTQCLNTRPKSGKSAGGRFMHVTAGRPLRRHEVAHYGFFTSAEIDSRVLRGG